MPVAPHDRRSVEFGDWQTPPALAERVVESVARTDLAPRALFEPTCGRGALLVAALQRFPATSHALGWEIDPEHVAAANAAIEASGFVAKARVVRVNAFREDMGRALSTLPEPILVVGNPPWITTAALGRLGGDNSPERSNRSRRGLDALTGKSNFDVSEWLLARLLDALAARRATLAMLCKTAVARKTLLHAAKAGIGLGRAEIHAIDARAEFGAAVGACLLILGLVPVETSDRVDSDESCRACATRRSPSQIEGGVSHTPYKTGECNVFPRLGAEHPDGRIGVRDGALIADLAAFERRKGLLGPDRYRWRSGIKHDASAVMELRREGAALRNGLGEAIALEETLLYPLLKGSALTRGETSPTRWLIVTQAAVGEDTAAIRDRAPKTWQYLSDHADRLDRRASAIYRGRPRFAIFGVGPYAFAAWKVAVSGFAKTPRFHVVGPAGGKPTVLDDTAYFLPCADEAEARRLAARLNSPAALDAIAAFLFPDAKRPITAELLERLNIDALADQDITT